MKKILVLIFFVGIQNIAVASQPNGECIIIRNNSTKNIIVNKNLRVVNEGEWNEIEGLNISKRDYPYRTIPQNEERVCIVIFPAYGLFENIKKNYYEKLAAIPLVDKLNAVFEEFTITDVEGNVLYDIAHMKEDDFIVEHYDDAYTILYILEISD